VASLRSAGSRLYVGGAFTTVGGVPASHVAYWDAAWHELAGGTDDVVLASAWYHDEIHLGGTFMNVRNGVIPSPGWAKYRETGVPWIVQQPQSQNATSGDNIAFSVQGAVGYGGLTHQWYRNGVALADGPTGTGSTISGVGAHVLNVSNVSHADAGLYQVVVSNGCGSTPSAEADLAVDGFTAVGAPGSGGTSVFEALGPNPCHGTSTLTFLLARDADVRVRVHDVAGRRVRTMEVGRLPAGRHAWAWDGRIGDGHFARTGLYFVGLEVDGARIGVRRLVVER
jgi:hypothetical protein